MARKQRDTLDALIFVDTNIFLDFYRVRGLDGGLSVLSHLASHHDRLIITSQVEMEFLKNRQDAILEAHRQFKGPDWGSLTAPAFLSDSKPNKHISAARKSIVAQTQRLKRRIEGVLTEPGKYDPVYKAIRPLFQQTSPYNLSRQHTARDRIRRLALKRFGLGYPPRKDSDTSIGDAINWEWMVQCAEDSGKHLIIVSRDSDYGKRCPDRPSLNDWLRVEFSDRVSNRRKLILTDKLTDALKLVAIPVTPKEVQQETELLEQPVAPSATAWPRNLREILTEEEGVAVSLALGLTDNRKRERAEVAKLLGLSEAGVQALFASAAAKMKKLLKDSGESTS